MTRPSSAFLALGAATLLGLQALPASAQRIEQDAGIGAGVTLPNTDLRRGAGSFGSPDRIGVPVNGTRDAPGYNGFDADRRLLSDGVDEGGVGLGGTPADPSLGGFEGNPNPFSADDFDLQTSDQLGRNRPLFD